MFFKSCTLHVLLPGPDHSPGTPTQWAYTALYAFSAGCMVIQLFIYRGKYPYLRPPEHKIVHHRINFAPWDPRSVSGEDEDTGKGGKKKRECGCLNPRVQKEEDKVIAARSDRMKDALKFFASFSDRPMRLLGLVCCVELLILIPSSVIYFINKDKESFKIDIPTK
ncbi:hypothetical protein MNV49_000340 [Pseudohyphozyma bogoriensis]|nr:hypothetical protein MNV49_000340 [Pseudohyphozyma bogoriensis]